MCPELLKHHLKTVRYWEGTKELRERKKKKTEEGKMERRKGGSEGERGEAKGERVMDLTCPKNPVFPDQHRISQV